MISLKASLCSIGFHPVFSLFIWMHLVARKSDFWNPHFSEFQRFVAGKLYPPQLFHSYLSSPFFSFKATWWNGIGTVYLKKAIVKDPLRSGKTGHSLALEINVTLSGARGGSVFPLCTLENGFKLHSVRIIVALEADFWGHGQLRLSGEVCRARTVLQECIITWMRMKNLAHSSLPETSPAVLTTL